MTYLALKLLQKRDFCKKRKTAVCSYTVIYSIYIYIYIYIYVCVFVCVCVCVCARVCITRYWRCMSVCLLHSIKHIIFNCYVFKLSNCFYQQSCVGQNFCCILSRKTRPQITFYQNFYVDKSRREVGILLWRPTRMCKDMFHRRKRNSLRDLSVTFKTTFAIILPWVRLKGSSRNLHGFPQ